MQVEDLERWSAVLSSEIADESDVANVGNCLKTSVSENGAGVAKRDGEIGMRSFVPCGLGVPNSSWKIDCLVLRFSSMEGRTDSWVAAASSLTSPSANG